MIGTKKLKAESGDRVRYTHHQIMLLRAFLTAQNRSRRVNFADIEAQYGIEAARTMITSTIFAQDIQYKWVGNNTSVLYFTGLRLFVGRNRIQYTTLNGLETGIRHLPSEFGFLDVKESIKPTSIGDDNLTALLDLFVDLGFLTYVRKGDDPRYAKHATAKHLTILPRTGKN